MWWKTRRQRVLLLLSVLLASCVVAEQVDEEHSVDTNAEVVQSAPVLTDALPAPIGLLDQYLPSGFGPSSFNATEFVAAFANSTDWTAIGFAFEDAVVATFQCLRLWAVFLVLAVVPIMQGLTVVGDALLPHCIAVVKLGADYVGEMDPVHQAMLTLTMLFVVVCIRKGYVHKARVRYVVMRRHLELRYRAFVASLSAKWRLVAILLPHVLFFGLAYEALYWLPDSVTDVLSSEALFGLLSVGYPLLHSIGVIRQKRLYPQRAKATAPPSGAGSRTSELRKRFEKIGLPDYEWRAYEACLKYWVIWSFAVCLVGMMTLFVPAFMVAFFTVPVHFGNIFLIWMHSPFTRGDITLYTLLSPVVSPYANRIHEREAMANAEGNETTNFLMRMLVSLRVVPERHLHFAKDLWSQGPALFGLIFIFTPGFVASRGCSLMGFGFPAYVTIGVLGEKRTRRYEWWLSYFSVAVTVDYLVTAIGREIAWLPLFYHAKLLMMMWLQFPYFQGAERIFDACFSSVFIVPESKED
ncbi:hypothetical protein BBJ28_00012764 [Nothophytophthora sp. Chile5]|nr:hypothetical protein BBJ28_00012764 [Nothophytophthora sp. Chile5]